MIELTREDGVARVRFDAPGQKVNLIGQEFLARLSEILDTLYREVSSGLTRAVVFESGKPGVYLAGADVNAFVAVAKQGSAALAAEGARAGQVLFARIAALPVPTVAAINGACLGGGLELALACTSRIAGDDGKVAIGLPEVRLGLIPGWGGTQRLPRLIGPSRALDLILTGRSLNGRQALKLGVVDAVVPAEGIVRAALAEALRLASGAKPSRPAWPFIDRSAPGRALVYSMARRRTLAQTHGAYPAPLEAIEAIRDGFSRPLAEGLAGEAERVGRLLVGPVSRNLVSIFLATRATSSSNGGDPEADPHVTSRVGVLGAGTMGGGIAAVTALAGLPVRLRDVSAEALARGMAVVREQARAARRKGRLTEPEVRLREPLVSPTVDDSGFGRCDLVIEAVVEDLEVKRQVLRGIEPKLPETAIFATNTSSLSVARIAQAAARPGRVLGLHFFNPVPKMPLVEVVRGPQTDEDAVRAVVAFSRRIGKTPVVVADTPGFIVNRILMPYLEGALGLVAGRSQREAGEAIARIDAAMKQFGMPMGPFALLDQIGLDVAAHVAGVLQEAFAERRRGAAPGGPRLLRAMMQAGLLGRKTAKGFYLYGAAKGRKEPVASGLNPEALRLVEAARGTGAEAASPGPLPASEGIVTLLVGAMIDEAALLLAEKAVAGPEVIDLAMVFGTGFPPYRGGLLRHADAAAGGHFYS